MIVIFFIMFVFTDLSATNCILQYKDVFNVKGSGEVVLGCNNQYYFFKKILQEGVDNVSLNLVSIEGAGKTGKYCFPSSGVINFVESNQQQADEIKQHFENLENKSVYDVSRENNPPIKNVLSNDTNGTINLDLKLNFNKQINSKTPLDADLFLVQFLDEKFQNSIDFLNEKEKNLIESIEEKKLNSENYILNFLANNHNTIDIKKDTDIKCSLYSKSDLDLIFVLYDNVKLTFSGFNSLLKGKIKFFLYNQSSITFYPDSFFGTNVTFKSMRSFIDQNIKETLPDNPMPSINFATADPQKPFVIKEKTLSFKDVKINRTANMELADGAIITIDNVEEGLNLIL